MAKAGAPSGSGPAENALGLSWIFGFSREVPLHNLCDENRQAVFYVSAHTGVIYDLNAKTQRLLQGHCNTISCTCATADRRYVATADQGADSMLVLWDSYTATPVKTIASPHPEGVRAMDISPDGKHLVTLSMDSSPQVLSVWDCTREGSSESPIFSAQVTTASGEPAEMQTSVRVDPSDPAAIVTNGASVVIFWHFGSGLLTYYSPPLGEHDFKQPIGTLTQSCFIPNSSRAVTATADGDAILWDVVEQGPGEPTEERRASKVVRLHNGAVSVLLTDGEYVVSGGADGLVRFFDFDFRIIAWFEDLDAGPVTSLSFAVPSPQSKKAAGKDGAVLTCPDFVVGTANALVVQCAPSMFDELEPSKRRGTLLVQGQDAMVHGLAAHPSLSRFAVTGRAGLLQLWDYAEKRLLLMRMFDKLLGHTLSFSPSGKFLAIGFTSGLLKVLMGMTLEEVATFKASKGCITQAAFSHDSTFLATADTDNCIGVYRLGNPGDDAAAKKEWVFVGKYRGHYKPVTGLQFGEGSDGSPRLFSTGEDRSLVEYDLARSSVQGGIQLRNTAKVEQTAVPTGCLFLPPGVQGAEPCIVTCNDQYKLRVVAPGPKSIQRTVVGPTYGGPLTRMLLLPTGDDGAAAAGGVGIEPYVAQLDGGVGGDFYQEMIDHFYYAQLRAQGEDTTMPRKITGEVPVPQLGNLMRALGFYPSQREIDEMTQEARLVAASKREHADSITFDEFLVMYVNHRPIFGVSKEQIAQAFAAISVDGSGSLSRESLLRALASHDEALAGDDLAQCLRMLTGTDALGAAVPELVDSKTFAEQVLGFQDYTAATGAP